MDFISDEEKARLGTFLSLMSRLHDFVGEVTEGQAPRDLTEAEVLVSVLHAGIHSVCRGVFHLLKEVLQEEALSLTRTIVHDATRLAYFRMNKERLDEMLIRFTFDSLMQEIDLEQEALNAGYETEGSRLQMRLDEKAGWEARAKELGIKFGGLPDTRKMMADIGQPGRYWAFRRFSHATHSSRISLATRRVNNLDEGTIAIGHAADVQILLMTGHYSSMSLIRGHRDRNGILGFGDNEAEAPILDDLVGRMDDLVKAAGLNIPGQG